MGEDSYREYRHRVHWPLIEDSSMTSEKMPAKMWSILEGHDPKKERYTFSTALRAFSEAVSVRWALGDDAGLVVAQDRLSALGRFMLEHFDTPTIQLWLRGFSIVGKGTDPAVVKELAAVMSGREHLDRAHRESQPGAHHILDAQIALVLGDDAAVLAACDAAEAIFATPQSWNDNMVPYLSLFRTVIAIDQTAFETSLEDNLAGWALLNAPTRESHAGWTALTESVVTLTCRVARWRNMHVPDSCYILPFND